MTLPGRRGAERCGMVHIDDLTKLDAGSDALLKDVSRMMRRNRRLRAGRVHLCALAAATRLFGSPRVLVMPNRCGVTSVVTNLGPAFCRAPLVGEDSFIRIEGETLRSVALVPPVRWLTPCTLGIVSYGGRVTLGMHYQLTAFSREQATELLRRLRRQAAASLTGSQVACSSLGSTSPAQGTR